MSNRVRTGRRMTTAEASDDGDIAAVFLVARQTKAEGTAEKKLNYPLGRNQWNPSVGISGAPDSWSLSLDSVEE